MSGLYSILAQYADAIEQQTRGEKPVNTTGAMGREQALAQRQRLIESGLHKAGDIRLVNRSWDAEARFFAVDVYGTNSGMPGARPIRHFQNIKQVDEYLASQQPLDVEPYRSTTAGGGTHYQFVVPGTHPPLYLATRNGSSWFSEEEIRRVGGVVEREGKRYRLGRKVFQPFVDTSK